MDKRCQICGDIGFVDALVTCRVCKNSREHAYCMPNFKGEVPPVWTCEACELRKQQTVSTKLGVNSSANLHVTNDSAGLNKFPINSTQGRVRWEKKVNKGKTKYISAHEAIKLSSGTNFTSRSPPRDKAVISGRAPLKANPVPQKFSPSRSTTNPMAGSTSHLKLQRQQQQTSQASKGPAQASKGPAQASRELKVPAQASRELEGPVLQASRELRGPVLQASRELRGPVLQASRELRGPTEAWREVKGFVHPEKCAYTKDVAHVERPLKAISKPVEDIGTANRKVQKEVGKVPCSSGSVPCPLKAISGDGVSINKKHVDFVDAKRNLMNISPQVLPTLPSDPALRPSWKGIFKIPSCLNDEVQAFPRSRVPRKVYEFSKNMPQVLEFNLLPRQHIWPDLYQNRFPDNNEIGLYFFPTDGDRNENYNSLVKFISGGDFVMRNYVNGVELLVFASLFLHVDCRKWNGNYFLWGTYRHVKKADVGMQDNLEVALLSPSIGADESEDADMEIDMVGGAHVGKVDVVIPRESNRISPAVSESGQSSSFVAKEMCIDIPPGFENYKLISDSPEVCGGCSLGAKKCKDSDSSSQIDNPEVMDRTSAISVPKSVTDTAGSSSGQNNSSKLAVSSRDNCGSGEDIHVKVKTEVL